jgi:hypothetical protein
VALVLVASVLGASIALAESALVDATAGRDAADRRAAATLAARLADDRPERYPPGVVRNRSTLSPSRVETLVPATEGAAVSVELGGRTLLERGDPSDGATVRRSVLVGTPSDRTVRVQLTEDEELTLGHRTSAVTLTLSPGPNTTVHTIRVNGRIVLHNDTGLSGEATVPTSVRRTTELAFESTVATAGSGTASPSGAGNATASTTAVEAKLTGHVDVSYTTVGGDPATLVVRVDG